MPQLYVLFEHAAGFAAFKTTEFEEIAVFLPQVKKSILDMSKFQSVLYFVAFQPFDKQKDAVKNMKSIASGELSSDLQLFLENNIPRSKQSKQPILLGVQEPELASAISDKLGIKCTTSGIVTEICRGIRFHFHKLVKGFTDINSGRNAQIALAHHYSREKVNFNLTQHDSMIIQSLELIDEFEKDIRIFTMRVREWYSYHFPELIKLAEGDHKLYVKLVDAIGDRKNLPEDIEEKLNMLISSTSRVETILQAVNHSWGMDISSVDLDNIKMFCNRIKSLIKQRDSTIDYLKAKMTVTAPNISKVVGEMIGSRLISQAGGLSKLAKLPASTVQVLGAEKKFFKTLKGSEAPPWGVLAQSSIIMTGAKKRNQNLARKLALKCCLASRVDCFSKTPDNKFGTSALRQIEDFVENLKNIDEKKSMAVKSKNKVNTKGETEEEANKTLMDEQSTKWGKLVNAEEDEIMLDLNESFSKFQAKQAADDGFVSEEDSVSKSVSEYSEPVVKVSRKRKSKSDKSNSSLKKKVSSSSPGGCKKSKKKKKLKN